jgi:transketolase
MGYYTSATYFQSSRKQLFSKKKGVYFMPIADKPMLEQIANTIRVLSMEGVQQANSGHPGLPMGTADIAAQLWVNQLQHDPADSKWVNRDRFVLSAGHGSMLLYSLLHLTGYHMPMEELKRFRQLDSLTPGHPEYGHTDGVETSTGPLGQGFCNAVGMAITEAMLRERFQTDGFSPVDHHVYTLMGDGCQMEGLTSEAASLAGHLGLGRLIALYDSNQITIEGRTDLAFTEDVGKRYEAYHWHVQKIDGHNFKAIADAVEKAKKKTDQPSLIICQTSIGKGSVNKEGTPEAHGAPLGVDEIKITREKLGWPDEPFHVPSDVTEFLAERGKDWGKAHGEWEEGFRDWREDNPVLAQEWDALYSDELPAVNWKELEYEAGHTDATRSSGGQILNKLAERLPQLCGGSADLAPSTKTLLKGEDSFAKGCYHGRNLHFGVREHAMGGIINGMVLESPFIVYGSTFFVFSDYMRGAIRLSALMGTQSIWVFTHDSIYVGEDGPTHQPVEHQAALNIIPNLHTFRPADSNETVYAWKAAVERRDGPTAILLTRQKLADIDRSVFAPAENTTRGGYVLKDADNPECVLMANGSEVSLLIEAAKIVEQNGKSVRIVSMPSLRVFEEQPEEYRMAVLPPSLRKRYALDVGVSDLWYRYAGLEGKVRAYDRFGVSGPYEELADRFGFTADAVAADILEYIG